MQPFLVYKPADMMHINRQTEAKRLDYEVLDIFTDGEYPVIKESFAARLKQLRKQKNLSQSELAEIVGVHYNHIGRYERGFSQPSADALHKLATALGVSSDYLIEGSTQDAAKADFEDRDLLRMFQEVQVMDKEDKTVVKKLIEAFVVKKQIASLASREARD